MKQKPDESPDQWIRQTLNQLPDAPPPGSSFNPDQLWAALRPELQPASRPQTRLMWWMAAACVAALVSGWFWSIYQSTPEPTVAHRHPAIIQLLPQQHSNSTRADELNRSKRVVLEAERPRVALHTHSLQQVRAKPVTTAPIATSAALPSSIPDDALTLVETPTVVDKLPDVPRQKVIGARPKRRFQVIHENELRAEEEAQPKLYRPDHFVRLGTGQTNEPSPEASRPTLLMPLTNKPNQ
ncbi:hypothetical protein [Spirosoma radiotolerans]|uniref:Uncharacterized protein n=1 Tax=Spirosoma radiotolerans TaxID=1379870 RepID=A0A0E3ZY72_9BACT|nr:hypothetical protein [Spirosoma radiotolerans]AKD57530.1 hypothetical protein SD10_24160 [Spirosoma radiotolerans]